MVVNILIVIFSIIGLGFVIYGYKYILNAPLKPLEKDLSDKN
jgi:hypothetical protein